MHATYIKNKEFDMSPQEQSLADDKMRAEIAKLSAEVARLSAEIPKLTAETAQVKVTTFLAPTLAAAALMGSTAAIVKIFF